MASTDQQPLELLQAAPMAVVKAEHLMGSSICRDRPLAAVSRNQTRCSAVATKRPLIVCLMRLRRLASPAI